MHCKNCGNLINNRMNYCNNCGAKIEKDINDDIQAQEYEDSTNEMQKNASTTPVFAILLSFIYSAIATFFLVKYSNGIEFISKECFNHPDFFMKIVGVIVIIAFILFFVTAFIGCMMLLGKWYECVGGLAYIFCVLGVIYGPWMLLSSLWRGHMELELGYSDPSMSDRQVYNEYQKLQAVRKFNGRR